MSDADSGGVFELDRIRSLIELMKEHDLSEIDLQEDERRIRLARAASAPAPADAPPAAAPQAAPAPAAAAPAAGDADGENIVYVTSPMVGTFYARANPNAEPYVKIGDNVDPETTICIVEAMKVFNEIPAEVRGKVVAVLVDDETPVEFGQRLFKVDTSM